MTFTPFKASIARELRANITAAGLVDPTEIVAEALSMTETDALEPVAYFTGYSIGQVRTILTRIRAQRPEQNV